MSIDVTLVSLRVFRWSAAALLAIFSCASSASIAVAMEGCTTGQESRQDVSTVVQFRRRGEGLTSQVYVSTPTGNEAHAPVELNGNTPPQPFRYQNWQRIGAGFLIYLPALLPEVVPENTRIDVPRGMEVYGSISCGGFIVIAPLGQARLHAEWTALLDPRLSDRDVQTIYSAADHAYQTMELNFISASPIKPILAVAWSGAGTTVRGEVSDNGILSVTLPESWDSLAEHSAEVQTLVSHEMFHMWFPTLATEDNADFLASEGAADYFSWLTSSAGDRSLMKVPIEKALNLCASGLDQASLQELSRQNMPQAAYSCGAVIQWLRDLNQQRDGADWFSPWRQLFTDDKAAMSEAGWSRSMAWSGDSEALRDLVEPYESGVNWAAFVRHASELGVAITSSQAPRLSYIEGIVRPLVTADCGEYYGVGSDSDGAIRVFSNDRCRLSGIGVSVTAIGGQSIAVEGPLLLRQAQAVCLSKQVIEIQLLRLGHPEIIILPCPAAFTSPSPRFEISNSGPTARP